jgi:hypothetical protein
MNSFSAVRFLLWALFAGALTLALTTRFSLLALLLLVATIAGLAACLAMHRGELRRRYQQAEDRAALPGPYDKILGRPKLTLRGTAPGVAILGCAAFYFADEIARGGEPTKLARLAFDLVGITGAIAFWVVLGTFLLAKGLEAWIGARVVQ